MVDSWVHATILYWFYYYSLNYAIRNTCLTMENHIRTCDTIHIACGYFMSNIGSVVWAQHWNPIKQDRKYYEQSSDKRLFLRIVYRELKSCFRGAPEMFLSIWTKSFEFWFIISKKHFHEQYRLISVISTKVGPQPTNFLVTKK